MAVLNLAVVYYHHQQILPAIDLLNPLYSALESLGEYYMIGICYDLIKLIWSFDALYQNARILKYIYIYINLCLFLSKLGRVSR